MLVKQKKAQITIFIIVAILLVAAVAMFFLFRNQSSSEVVDSELAPIQNFIQTCISDTGEEAIYDTAFSGGYFFPPELSTDLGIPYYYSNGKNYVPSKEELEEQVSLTLDSTLILCLEGLEDFTDYEISFEDSQTQATIEDDSVSFDVEFPISITKGNSTTLIKDFNNIEIPGRLGIVYNSASEIVSEQTEDGICLSCATDISIENDVYIEIVDYDKETAIFLITDENSKLDDRTLEYIFAVGY